MVIELNNTFNIDICQYNFLRFAEQDGFAIRKGGKYGVYDLSESNQNGRKRAYVR